MSICPFVTNLKFVDDKTLFLSYSGNPTKTLQKALDIELKETLKGKMIINESKCYSFIINFSKFNTGPENLQLNGKLIQPVDKMKLLGVILSNDLKWSANTSYIYSKGNRRLYLINKLKQFGLKSDKLIKAWSTHLRPITELSAPLWHSGLSVVDSNKLELLKKSLNVHTWMYLHRLQMIL